MQLWCCCLALKPFPMIFRIHKVGGNIFRVPLDTGGDPEGVDLLSALAAGWPPWVNKKGLFSFPMVAEAKIWTPKGRTNILKKEAKQINFAFQCCCCIHICICSPGVLQGVRLSRKFSNRSVLQPQVVDEVVKIVAHPHLCSSCSRSCNNQVL